jgi:RNA polymerase sigma-70 factor, ECF subfamily
LAKPPTIGHEESTSFAKSSQPIFRIHLAICPETVVFSGLAGDNREVLVVWLQLISAFRAKESGVSGPSSAESNEKWRRWIEQARQGSREALGLLLDKCRNYLLVVAHGALDPQLQSKAGSSDLVQETYLQAQRNFARFTGTNEAELLAWLRGILLNNAADFSRRFQETAKRQVDRERALNDPQSPPADATASFPSPSEAFLAREQDVSLEKALLQLPEDHRRVIELRNFEGLPFEEIGRRMDRSADTARKLWGRALKKLQALMGADDASR